MTATDTFFRSRWVKRPAHVTELGPTTLPAGFRAAGVAAGLKPEGLDVGVLLCDDAQSVSAARFTTNARVGAPDKIHRMKQRFFLGRAPTRTEQCGVGQSCDNTSLRHGLNRGGVKDDEVEMIA